MTNVHRDYYATLSRRFPLTLTLTLNSILSFVYVYVYLLTFIPSGPPALQHLLEEMRYGKNELGHPR